MIRIVWDTEEMVALADICLRREKMTKAQIEGELKALSKTLIFRADKLGIVHDDKYRNFNGMKYTYQNMLFVITDGKEGMSNANKGLYDVYDMWKNRRDSFNLLLENFNSAYREREQS